MVQSALNAVVANFDTLCCLLYIILVGSLFFVSIALAELFIPFELILDAIETLHGGSHWMRVFECRLFCFVFNKRHS